MAVGINLHRIVLVMSSSVLIHVLYTPVFLTESCGRLAPPANGGCNPCDAAIGQQAHFTCDDQYGLIGSSSITCLSGTHWSGSVPVCKS